MSRRGRSRHAHARLARRTRRFPEVAIGLHIAILVVGYITEFLGIEAAASHPETGIVLRGFANLCYAVSIQVYLLFTWRVFRIDSRAARAAAAVGTLVLAVGWTGEALTSTFGFDLARFEAPWFWLAFVPRLVAMAWASGEAFVHHGKLVRRMRLGLGDPGVTNRLALWGLAALSELMIYAVVAITILAGQPDGFLAGPAALFVSAFGVGGATCMWLAFFPPPAYERWIARASAC